MNLERQILLWAAAGILLVCLVAMTLGLSFLLGTPKRTLGIRMISISGAVILALTVGLILMLSQDHGLHH